MPLSYVYRGGSVRFSFSLMVVCPCGRLHPYASCTVIVCLGIAIFGNKFLIIQKKKKTRTFCKLVMHERIHKNEFSLI